MPLKMRSDHGGETSVISALHFFLSSRRKKPRSISNEIQLPGPAHEGIDGQQEEELVPIEFKDCWIFGRSIHNTRIESWWHLLYTGVIHRWRDYFQWLTDNHHFTKGYRADQVAILFMYMNPIRKECQDYVSDWNIHRIRSQPYNSHVVTGQVNVLYYDSEAPQVAEPVPEDLLQFCAEKLDLEHADLDAFLPAETMAVCSRIIEEQFGRLPERPRNINFPFVHEYVKLKRELQRYIDEKQEPALTLIEPVTEGSEILEEMLKVYDPAPMEE